MFGVSFTGLISGGVFWSGWVNERTRNLSSLDHKLDLESGEETKSGNVHSTNLRSHHPQQRRCIRRIVVAAIDHHESLAADQITCTPTRLRLRRNHTENHNETLIKQKNN